jgi:hypothetical protein
MTPQKPRDFADFQGIEVRRTDAHDELRDAVRSAVEATSQLFAKDVRNAHRGSIRMAYAASIQTVNALMSAVDAKCNLAPPPEEIEMRPGSTGNLIYRCFHNPAHEWDLNGNRLQ